MFFFFKQKTAYEISACLVGSEMCIRDSDQLGKYIYVVNDSNIVRYRHIETGQLIGDSLRQIRAGITPRERYVTKALMKVRDGMKVHPIDN